jgi:hypothetical protein
LEDIIKLFVSGAMGYLWRAVVRRQSGGWARCGRAGRREHVRLQGLHDERPLGRAVGDGRRHEPIERPTAVPHSRKTTTAHSPLTGLDVQATGDTAAG